MTAGWADVILGDWPSILEVSERCGSGAVEVEHPAQLGHAEATLGVIAGLRGDAPCARSHAARAETLAGEDCEVLLGVYAARALAWLAVGDPLAAFLTLRAVVGVPGHGRSHRVAHVSALFAEAALRSGRQAEGRTLIRSLATDVAALSTAARCEVAVAAAILSEDGTNEGLLPQTIGNIARGFPFARARLELMLGMRLRRARALTASRIHLQTGIDLFDLLGCASWRAFALCEARAAGMASLHGAANKTADLSPQEYEVAQLAAQGLSNREIGLRLFLSPRTVGSHLYRIFPKFSISSRAQLAGKLQSQDSYVVVAPSMRARTASTSDWSSAL